MCGITGYLKPQPAPDDTGLIKQMLAMIRHRGPDEMGYFIDNSAALGTARLSIIDVQAGQQPLSAAEGRYWISYNGEVYNYLELRNELIASGCNFQTASDTEVVLQLFINRGVESFALLNGGFAFCIYDRQKREAWLVRDSFGKRPLYYHHSRHGLVYGSEIKSFLPHPDVDLQLDPERIATIARLWVPLSHESAFRGVDQVPAGAYLHYKDGKATVKTYWALDLHDDSARLHGKAAVEEAASLLDDAVKIRLRSDVEVGTYLSGGLDSAIITRLAQKHSDHQVRTFSVAFEDSAYDESNEQNLLSEYFGTNHVAFQVAPKQIAEEFPEAIWHAEVPVFRTAFVPLYCLSRVVRESGIKVVLTGEGADESFFGYNIFKEARLRANWDEFDSLEKKLNAVAAMYPYVQGFRENARSYVAVFDKFTDEKAHPLFSHFLRFHNSQFCQRLFKESGDTLAGLNAMLPEDFGKWDTLEKARWLEFQTLLMGYLLSTQGDRASLAHGVEARCPFLDKRVVEFATRVSQSMHLTDDFTEKNLLKEAFRGIIPPMILSRPKQPYRAPDAVSFFGVNSPVYLDELLSTDSIKSVGFLDVGFCSSLFGKLRGSDPMRISARENQAFLMLLSVLWLHRFFVAKQRSPVAAIDDILAIEANFLSV